LTFFAFFIRLNFLSFFPLFKCEFAISLRELNYDQVLVNKV